MFNYCPLCASQKIRYEQERHAFRCPDCGFSYYHNIAAATGLIVDTGGAIMLLERGKEPARGRLDVPGGFLDRNESLLDGLRRECREELDWDPGEAPVLFASFPNTYLYKNIEYYTCDCFFSVHAPGLSAKDLHLQASEIAAAHFIPPAAINMADFGFPSTRRAVTAYLKTVYGGR
jgi:ADP-ribose pyrophosphatase YjhB (NUDIX family)